jgi:hypothetical protein
MRLSAAAVLLLCASVSAASAQEQKLGAGRVEVGGFPMGGAAFVGGDDDTEVNINTYSIGANLTYYVNRRTAIEGELGIGLGLAQDVLYRKRPVPHVQVPNVWDYFGNVLFFPVGATGRHLPYYVTAGVGAVALQSRQPTKPFGYDSDILRFQTFTAENIGGGVKIFRVDPPDWGFRIDYRYLIVNANSDAPIFFAKATRRTGHRLTFGVLYTWKPLP